MKKMFVAAVVGFSLCGLAGNGVAECTAPDSPVNDECVLSWWSGAPASNLQKDLKGCCIGIGSGFRSVRGAQISLCMNKVEEFKGGCQFAIGYNSARTMRNGPQIAFVNCAEHAALQFGLLCFNKGGFLPFFPFFNFDKTAFGAVK